jgi:hypothetical protein
VADAEVAGKIRTLNEGKALNIDFSELMGAESPVYDDNDELAHA